MITYITADNCGKNTGLHEWRNLVSAVDEVLTEAEAEEDLSIETTAVDDPHMVAVWRINSHSSQTRWDLDAVARDHDQTLAWEATDSSRCLVLGEQPEEVNA